MISLIVDKKLDDDLITPSRNLPVFDQHNWEKTNISLLFNCELSGEFKIYDLDSFDNTVPNPYYVISLKTMGDIIDCNVWDYISEKSKKFILENNLSILFWFPFETISYTTNNQWKTFIDNRNAAGFRHTKTIMFSLSKFLDLNGKQIVVQDHYDDNPLYYIESIAFLPHYGSNTNPLNENRIKNLKNKCFLFDHKNIQKKYKFLCLNNTSRPNRVFLLQALFQNKELWDNNLISCRHDPSKKLLMDSVVYRITKGERDHYSDFKFKKFIDLIDFELITNMCNVFLAKERIKNNLKKYVRQDQDLYDFNYILNYIDQNFIPNSEITSFMSEFILNYYEEIYPKRVIDDHVYLNESWEKTWYTDSWFSLITETHCFNDTLYHESPMITEKTVKAILNFHPFIIFGHSASQNFLKALGFKTFDQSFLDLPEELTAENITFFERLKNLTEGLLKFQKLSNEEIYERYKNIEEDLKHNYKLLTTANWFLVQHDIILRLELENKIIPVTKSESLSLPPIKLGKC